MSVINTAKKRKKNYNHVMSECETKTKLRLLFGAEIVLLVFVSSGCVFAHKGSGTEACRSGGV